MMRLRFIWILFIMLSGTSFSLSAQSGPAWIVGLVFEDVNDNGRMDGRERGLKGIGVSNGDTIVLSDRNGRFKLPVAPGVSVFPILPADYGLSLGIQNGDFVYLPRPEEQNKELLYFPLIKRKALSQFRMSAVGDMQVDNLQELHYAHQTVLSELVQRQDLDFHLFLGDQVNSDSGLETKVKAVLNQLQAPVWTVYGNHDRSVQAVCQDSVYNSHFGASTYAFTYGKIHFIVLNNIWSDGSRSYHGRYSDSQLRFLANNLKLLPKDQTVVIAQHIPMVFTRNRDDLLALLGEDRRVLVLSGHTHRVSRHFFGENVSELVVGASSGNWWTGERDFRGLPHASMQDGSPRNYFVLDFEGSDYKFQFKGVGMDAQQQMHIWLAGQDSIDKTWAVDLEGTLVANIYAGSEKTEAYFQVNNGEWIKMERTRMADPSVQRLVALNRADVYPSAYSQRSALRSSASSHIWTAKLPDLEGEGPILRINIKAHDDYGFSVVGTTLFFNPAK